MNNALYRAADVRELERRAIELHGLSADVLMERAGAALFARLRERCPAAGRLLVLCGGGNNGGDGYVAARLARTAGIEVVLCALTDPDRLAGAAKKACDAWEQAGGTCEDYSDDRLARAEVVIDALLGTGLDRPVTGRLAEVIDRLNAHPAPVIAADIPSGLHADTGAVLGRAVRADHTVTFIGFKPGLFTGRGREQAGEVQLAALDLPAAVHVDLPPFAERLDPATLNTLLPPRARDAHKGNFGHVAIVGGGPGMPGAVRLAGEAALRAGAGKVSAGVHPGNVAAVAGNRPELMCHVLDDGNALPSLLQGVNVLAAGPGLGQGEWSARMWEHLRQAGATDTARVLDADALNWLAAETIALTPRDVITPHPGEAARLLGCDVARVESDRFAAVRELVGRYECVVVLKGAGTIVADPAGRVRVCDRGNPGMAAAGTGDVLTGLVAGLRAQGLNAFDAACTGVLVHALAGDAAAGRGERGLLAGDLLDEVRSIVNPAGMVGSA